jgi:hypothetical protein
MRQIVEGLVSSRVSDRSKFLCALSRLSKEWLEVPSGYLGRRCVKKQRQNINVPIGNCVARAQHCLCCWYNPFWHRHPLHLSGKHKKVEFVVLHRRQPENVKGKSKNEQPPVGTFGTAKESSLGLTCCSQARPPHAHSVTPTSTSNRGGEAPPALGRAPTMIGSRVVFSFEQTPDPAPSEISKKEEES